MTISPVPTIKKTQTMVIRDLIKAIIDEGYMVRVRCADEGDVLQSSTDNIKAAMDAVDSVEHCMVEAVSCELNRYDQSVKYWFYLKLDNPGREVITDLIYLPDNALDRIYAKAIL